MDDDGFDCTQALSPLEEGENIFPLERRQVAVLEVNDIRHEVFTGANIIGRNDKCSIVIDNKSISGEHAIIEVDVWESDLVHLLSDMGSRNKTRLGQLVLKPHAKYRLKDGDVLQIADVKGIYHVTQLQDNSEIDSSLIECSYVERHKVSERHESIPCSKSKEGNEQENENIYSATTQLICPDKNILDSDTDEEEVFVTGKDKSPASEKGEKSNDGDIYDAKTQKIELDDFQADSKKSYEHGSIPCSKSKEGSELENENIYSATTQLICPDRNILDSDTNDREGEFVSAKDKSPVRKKGENNNDGDIYDAKTEKIERRHDFHTDSKQSHEHETIPCSKSKEGNEQENENIYSATTQLICPVKNAVDSDTDEEGVFVSAKSPVSKKGEKNHDGDIYDAKTQKIELDDFQTDSKQSHETFPCAGTSLGSQSLLIDEISSTSETLLENEFQEPFTPDNIEVDSTDSEALLKDYIPLSPLLFEDSSNDSTPSSSSLKASSSKTDGLLSIKPENRKTFQAIIPPKKLAFDSSSEQCESTHALSSTHNEGESLEVPSSPLKASGAVQEEECNTVSSAIPPDENEKDIFDAPTQKILVGKSPSDVCVKIKSAQDSGPQPAAQAGSSNTQHYSLRSQSGRKAPLSPPPKSSKRTLKSKPVSNLPSSDLESRPHKKIANEDTSETPTYSKHTTYRVLFTRYNCPRHEDIVKQLGGCLVSSIDEANVLVTDKLRRTVKLLSMMGRGQPIVCPEWLSQSQKAGRLLDPWDYLLSDAEAERKFNFTMEDSLKKAADKPLLQSYSIYLTKNVTPPLQEMKEIVTSCGGTVLTRAPSKWPLHSVVVSCENDLEQCKKFKGKVVIVSCEWLLSGVLKQELDVSAFKLE